jgi:hypothetical protein
MKPSKCIAASILTIAISILITKPALAGAISQTNASLTLTENSSTDLSLSYTGPDEQPGLFTVMNTGPDMWTITVAQNLGPVFFNDFSNGWIEPENAATVNEVSHSTDVNSNQLFVKSDLSIALNTSVSADNTAILVGMDSTAPIYLTFHDLAQASEATGVPDTGTTLGLLALSAIVLLGMMQSRSVLRS